MASFLKVYSSEASGFELRNVFSGTYKI